MEKVTMIWGTEAVKGIEKPEEGYTKKTLLKNEKLSCLECGNVMVGKIIV